MINVASLVADFCMCSPSFIHPAVCGSLSYFKWFATLTSTTPMFNPCMSIHHLYVCGSLSYFKWFATFTGATPMFNPCMCNSSILLYVVRSVTLSGLPRSQVRHLCSTHACAIIHSSILLYVVRSVTLSGLPRSQV